MNTSPQRELKHLKEAVQSSPPPPRRSWVVIAAASAAVVALVFLAMLYVQWSADLAGRGNPTLDASVVRQEAAPSPTVAASEMEEKSSQMPEVAVGSAASAPQYESGPLVVSQANLTDRSINLLRQSIGDSFTVPGDLQSCVASLESAMPIRRAEQVIWQGQAGDAKADAWLIVTSTSPLHALQHEGGVIEVVVMPVSCSESNAASESKSYDFQKISVPVGLLPAEKATTKPN